MKVQRAIVKPPVRSGRRGLARRTCLVALGVAAMIATTLIVFKPWRPMMYGSMAPPSAGIPGLETAVQRRIAEVTALVLDAPYDAATWGRLGSVYQVHDLLDEAITCYDRAERLDGSDYRWPYLRGLCRRVGDQRGARVDFRRAAALRNDYAPLHIHLGLVLLLEDAHAAEASFRRALELDPRIIRGHLGLGAVALQRGEAPVAVEHLQRAVALGPQQTEVYWLLAEAFRETGDAEAAQTNLELAGDENLLEPLSDPVYDEITGREGVSLIWRRRRTDALIRANRYDEALAEWRQLLEDEPDSGEGHFEIGLILVTADRLAEALPHYRAAATLDPDNATRQAELGTLLAHLGVHDEAIAALRRAIDLDPGSAGVRDVLGGLLMLSGETEEGLIHIRRAAADAPDDPGVLLNLALALKQLGEWEEAIETIERMIAIAPIPPRVRFEYGVLLSTANRLPEAEAAFVAVLAETPAQSAAWRNLAQVQERSGRDDAALATLRDGLRRAPGSRVLLNDLALFLASCPNSRLRNGTEAIAIASRLCRDTRYQDPRLLNTLAAAEAESGDFEAAIAIAEQAIGLLTAGSDPEPVAGTLLGDVQSRLVLYRQGLPYRRETAR